jgi:hypothetical protein
MREANMKTNNIILGCLFVVSTSFGIWEGIKPAPIVPEMFVHKTDISNTASSNTIGGNRAVMPLEIELEYKEVFSGRDLLKKKYLKTFPSSNLNNYFDRFFEVTKDERKSRLMLAISASESGFGTKGRSEEFKNAWGYFCTRSNKKANVDCGWSDWDYSIKRYSDLVEVYYKKWDGTKEGLRNTFIGSYCVDGCQDWVKNVWSYYTY